LLAVFLTDLIARAGGGHSFGGAGGGGGLGGGGGGFGGGGPVFFGGGGGGSGGIGAGIVFIIVAAIIVLVMLTAFGHRRMRGALSAPGAGTADPSSSPSPSPSPWTGSQAPAIDSVRGDVFPGTAAAASAASVGGTRTSVEEGLAQIQSHDPAFDQDAFLEQVQRAFFVVEEAWADRKPEMSRQVMADAIWQQHRVQIQGYVNEHKRNVLSDLAVGDLTIIGAHSDQTYDTVTVRVLAACADYDVDDQSGRVVRGNKRVEQWQEDWTFQRSAGATTKPEGGTLSSEWPNCGAPLDVDLEGVCKYCHAPVMSGKYDWVLARISQVAG
jgi:predicted lipid-binding transport protein (Tim44 family)